MTPAFEKVELWFTGRNLSSMMMRICSTENSNFVILNGIYFHFSHTYYCYWQPNLAFASVHLPVQNIEILNYLWGQRWILLSPTWLFHSIFLVFLLQDLEDKMYKLVFWASDIITSGPFTLLMFDLADQSWRDNHSRWEGFQICSWEERSSCHAYFRSMNLNIIIMLSLIWKS